MSMFKKSQDEQRTVDMKDRPQVATGSNDGVISIVGSGMKVNGDVETEGTIRIEGRVEGTVRAGKAVVVGKDGRIKGDIFTQDAVVGGEVNGTIVAESRIELQATCVVDGEIRARRIQLDEGGRVNGRVHTGEVTKAASGASGSTSSAAPGSSSGSSSSDARSSAGGGNSGASSSSGADSRSDSASTATATAGSGSNKR
ncbi:MAG TPA: polymer-forming cytoskeletal protein [Longimicrobiales bacterium]|nr:polymer-forming cytoskeletal protein [Longimicrobiales bacterium]